jgi:hypothetical protein
MLMNKGCRSWFPINPSAHAVTVLDSVQKSFSGRSLKSSSSDGAGIDFKIASIGSKLESYEYVEHNIGVIAYELFPWADPYSTIDTRVKLTSDMVSAAAWKSGRALSIASC